MYTGGRNARDPSSLALIPMPPPSPLKVCIDSLRAGETVDASKLDAFSPSASKEPLGRLLVEMTSQVQDERAKRSEVEKRNQALLIEMEQLQQEVMELKTSLSTSEKRSWPIDNHANFQRTYSREASEEATLADHHIPSRQDSADFWWKELQEAKKAKDKALVEAHQRAMQVMELNACISMQHDELKALRANEQEMRHALLNAEERTKEMTQQHVIMMQENQLLKDDVAHLNGEIGKRGQHFKALMEKWTEAQAQSEHFERENHAMLEKMKEIRLKSEQQLVELEKTRDERDCLQHQVNHLKGAVAAKAAESKAFQAYGTNARDHLQAQSVVIQRNHIFRRKINKIARESIVVLKNMKSTLAAIRAPLVTIQTDFRVFLKNLQRPVFTLVSKSKNFVDIAHAERQPLREALLTAELTRRHLHDQLWKSRLNALMVCQIWNTSTDQTVQPRNDGADHHASELVGQFQPLSTYSLRANYSTGELLFKEGDAETVAVKFDAIYSDRAREWNDYESISPLLQSVLDGYNACVVTYDGLLPIRTYRSDATNSGQPDEIQQVPELVLQQLFQAVKVHSQHLHRIKLTISYLAVYNECVYDLLGMDTTARTEADQSSTMSKIVVLEVQNVDEAMFVLNGGQENLRAAHENGAIHMRLTHKVITVCVSYENLLTGIATTKSKLQIAALATGEDESITWGGMWDERNKVKSLVTMENGINALVNALAEVRMKDPAFVRYHSSKLTVLLQDTVKVSAKFLSIVALPTAMPMPPQANSPLGGSISVDRIRSVIRLLELLHSAVSLPSSSPWKSHHGADRSLQGFMQRFAQKSLTSEPSQSLLFSSGELQERIRNRVSGDNETSSKWEKELDVMQSRYSTDVFTTCFFHPGLTKQCNASPVGDKEANAAVKSSDSGSISSGSSGERTPPPAGAIVHPHSFSYESPVSTPKSSGTKSKNMGRSTDRLSKPRTPHTKAQRHMTTPLTLAPSAQASTTKAPTLVRIRRETASSAMKRTRAANSVRATSSPSTRLQRPRTPFK
ncbi:TPA: hypothetical protein N0F65_006056 [Lagenidium giganteum]|uniref:Kinesin motor domain-containing protein n=1 Tax=Lagenidium giganteum TaxID=4803 RepID=A0AAV2YJW8_9STRA|nr:TPA: hypothetical protein N0F65_006056 [Lagenidium giganteum]